MLAGPIPYILAAVAILCLTVFAYDMWRSKRRRQKWLEEDLALVAKSSVRTDDG